MAAPITARWVAIYLRISRDRSGRAENVDTQLGHAVTYVERQWPGVAYEVYRDNDLTAADPGTHRPDYERLLTDVRAGRVAQVVSADQDRLTRQPAEWEALMPVLLTAGVTETHGYRDGITSVEPGKRAPGRFKSAMAAEYVEGLKVKLHEKFDKLADDGRPHGGRTFGYKRTVDADGAKTLEVIPERAVVMRWAADEILSGHTIASVAGGMEARGFGHWGHSSVVAMLRSPTNAGFRSYRGDPEYRRGTWDPIFDEVTWRRLCATLDKPREVLRPDGTVKVLGGRRRPARRYLLGGGFVCCARCGVPLVGRHIAGRKPIYVCTKERGGCGRLGATAGEPLPDGAAGVEATVAAELLARLQSPEFLAQLAVDDSNQRRSALTEQIEGIGLRRRKLAGRWARGDVADEDWDGAREEFDAELSRLNTELAGLEPYAAGIDPAAVVDGWVHMDLAERRQVVDRCIERVEVRPATPGVKFFDPARVRIVWRA